MCIRDSCYILNIVVGIRIWRVFGDFLGRFVIHFRMFGIGFSMMSGILYMGFLYCYVFGRRVHWSFSTCFDVIQHVTFLSFPIRASCWARWSFVFPLISRIFNFIIQGWVIRLVCSKIHQWVTHPAQGWFICSRGRSWSCWRIINNVTSSFTFRLIFAIKLLCSVRFIRRNEFFLGVMKLFSWRFLLI